MITIETKVTIDNRKVKFQIEWTPNRMLLKVFDEDRVIKFDSNNLEGRSVKLIESFFTCIHCDGEFNYKPLKKVFDYFKARTKSITQIFSEEIEIRDCPICDTCKHIYQFHPIFDENLGINMNTTFFFAL